MWAVGGDVEFNSYREKWKLQLQQQEEYVLKGYGVLYWSGGAHLRLGPGEELLTSWARMRRPPDKLDVKRGV